MRDRYYSSDTGRFTRSDVFEGRLTDPLSFNKYLYTHGNPVNAIDPSRLFTLQEATTALVILGILSNGVQLGLNLNGYFNSESDEERIKYTISAGFNLLGLLLATPTTTFIPPASGGAAALVPAVVSLERVIGSVAIPISQGIFSIASSGSGNSGGNIYVKDENHVNDPKHCLDDLAPSWFQQKQLFIDAVKRIAPNVPTSGGSNPVGTNFSFSTYIRNSNGTDSVTEIRAFKYKDGRISINTAFVPTELCSHPLP